MRTATALGFTITTTLLVPLGLACSGADPTNRADGSGTGASNTGAGGTSSGAETATATTAGDPTASSASATGSGNGGAGTNVTAAASTSVEPVVDGVGGTFVGNRGTGGSIDACQNFDIQFTPDIPTVFVLVDRSSSMWDRMLWDPFRDGVLEVIQTLNEDVRFGFGTFTGITGQTCPLDLQVAGDGAIARNNFQTISDFYMPIVHPGVATQTPTAAAVQAAHGILEADYATFPGPKFILLVTDGEPDYCDDGDEDCRADTLVRALQDAYASTVTPIHTFLVTLPGNGIEPEWLAAFANAGAGQPVAEVSTNVVNCGNNPPPAETAALFPYDFPHGTYGDTMGPATHYEVDPANRAALVEEIGGVVAGVKSCIFDLESDLGSIEVDPEREDEGTILIKTVQNPEGVALTYDPTGVDGWWVIGEQTQIELTGSACELLRNPETTGIEFGFPCDIIVVK